MNTSDQKLYDKNYPIFFLFEKHPLNLYLHWERKVYFYPIMSSSVQQSYPEWKLKLIQNVTYGTDMAVLTMLTKYISHMP